jgi:hypothetical protein
MSGAGGGFRAPLSPRERGHGDERRRRWIQGSPLPPGEGLGVRGADDE